MFTTKPIVYLTHAILVFGPGFVLADIPGLHLQKTYALAGTLMLSFGLFSLSYRLMKLEEKMLNTDSDGMESHP